MTWTPIRCEFHTPLPGELEAMEAELILLKQIEAHPEDYAVLYHSDSYFSGSLFAKIHKLVKKEVTAQIHAIERQKQHFQEGQ